MKIYLELFAGSNRRSLVTKTDINRNIEVLDRAVTGKVLAGDSISLADTKSILEEIRNELPEE